jgi:hypothetical protein
MMDVEMTDRASGGNAAHSEAAHPPLSVAVTTIGVMTVAMVLAFMFWGEGLFVFPLIRKERLNDTLYSALDRKRRQFALRGRRN